MVADIMRHSNRTATSYTSRSSSRGGRQEMSPRSVGSGRQSPHPFDMPDADYVDDFDDHDGLRRFQQDGGPVPLSVGSDGNVVDLSASSGSAKERRSGSSGRRAQSAQRSSQGEKLRIVGVSTNNDTSMNNSRSRSAGRSTAGRSRTGESIQSTYSTSLETPEESSENGSDNGPNGSKKRKSKMEKIRQLQAKNELYKDEFKRVQKDRKHLKRDVEKRKLEVASLTKEIDTNIAENSMLKLQLSEALQQLDQTDQDERKDKATIMKLSKELSNTKVELAKTTQRVAHLKQDLASLHEKMKQKNEEIQSLTDEVAEQTDLLEAMRKDNSDLRQLSRVNTQDEDRVEELTEEKKKLQTELGETLERAAALVKEREDAIADLLKENEDMKKMLEMREQHDNNEELNEHELNQLREELDNTIRALEENQDRNVLLEEEVEAWINRGGNMETELERLRDEVEAWQHKASAAEESVAVVEESAKQAEMKARAARTALTEAETLHKQQIAEAESQIRAANMAVLEARCEADTNRSTNVTEYAESMDGRSTYSEENGGTAEYQADLLARSVASAQLKNKNKKGLEPARGGRWFGLTGASKEPEEEVDESQKRIRELETTNSEQEEEIKALKSELVKLRSTYKETMYETKKKTEKLEEENEKFCLKIVALERELAGPRNEQEQPGREQQSFSTSGGDDSDLFGSEASGS